LTVDICTPMNRPDGRMTDLIAANGCLLVFVDDTGHETFAGDQPYYGLGGCAVMIEAYEPLKARWKSLRRLINGHEDLPLHASTLKPDPTHLGALVEFFRDQSFFRLAVTTTQNMDYPAHLLHSVQPVIEQLKKYVVSIISSTPCQSVAIIFEQSQRGDPLLQKYFGALQPNEAIPVEHCICPKSFAEPGLEIADFIVNAAGSETRRRERKTPGFAKDFQAVFHAVPDALHRFCMIEKVG
jgi:hypothetical protein